MKSYTYKNKNTCDNRATEYLTAMILRINGLFQEHVTNLANN